LNDVPQHLFELNLSPHGEAYHRLVFDVEISVQSVLEFSVSIKGTRYGSVTATYT
jgi:hypothetical protein